MFRQRRVSVTHPGAPYTIFARIYVSTVQLLSGSNQEKIKVPFFLINYPKAFYFNDRKIIKNTLPVE